VSGRTDDRQGKVPIILSVGRRGRGRLGRIGKFNDKKRLERLERRKKDEVRMDEE
jgi:hypothetical protein